VVGSAKGEYALGRSRLPPCISVPLVKVSEKIGAKPFMEYAQSYALYNYKRIDVNKGLEYENLDLIRTFSGLPSEYVNIFELVDLDLFLFMLQWLHIQEIK
jgi:hypothetical protein